jgi:hypothetical protein
MEVVNVSREWGIANSGIEKFWNWGINELRMKGPDVGDQRSELRDQRLR